MKTIAKASSEYAEIILNCLERPGYSAVLRNLVLSGRLFYDVTPLLDQAPSNVSGDEKVLRHAQETCNTATETLELVMNTKRLLAGLRSSYSACSSKINRLQINLNEHLPIV